MTETKDENPSLIQRLRKIRLLLLDVDGVLTDGQLYFDAQGQEIKAFNTLDGHGIKMLRKSGVEVGIISGRKSKALDHRIKTLALTHVVTGQEQKLSAFEGIKKSCALNDENIAFMGDDYPDLPVMKRAGIALSVPNAHNEVKKQSDWISTKTGGMGAVREVTDLIMQAQESYAAFLEPYLA